MDVSTFSNKSTDTTCYLSRPSFEDKFRAIRVYEIIRSSIIEILGEKRFEYDESPEWIKASMLLV